MRQAGRVIGAGLGPHKGEKRGGVETRTGPGMWADGELEETGPSLLPCFFCFFVFALV